MATDRPTPAAENPITPRQRVWHAIRHEEPDRVPWHFSYTIPAQQKLETYFGTNDLDGVLGNHLVKYRPRASDAWHEVRPGYWRDEFGVIWNRTVDKDIGVVDHHPLLETPLADHPFPNPHDSRRYAALPGFLAAHPEQFCYVSIGFSLFERAWTLRGMEQLMIDMLESPEGVDALLDRIAAFDRGILEEVLGYDIDGVMFGDDWGQQKGLLFGKRLWRRFIRPRIADLYGMVKRAGKAVLIHSCGQVQELFPDLIEIGLDVFNPFQPEAMDPYQTKRQFGSQLTFLGGVSVQRLLPFGKPVEIRNEVRLLMDQVGQGGGFIIAPSHDMPGDIPIENMIAFIEAARAR